MEETFDFWKTPEGGGIHPADCMQQLLEQVRRHRVNIDGNICTVIVTTLVLEVHRGLILCFYRLIELRRPVCYILMLIILF